MDIREMVSSQESLLLGSETTDLKSKMLIILKSAYSRIQDAFDSIPIEQHWLRRAAKEFFASAQVLDLEDKINEQCLIVLRGETEKEQIEALNRVEEGMDYLVKIMLHQIGKGAQ